MKKVLLSATLVLSLSILTNAQVGYFNLRLNYIDGTGAQAGKLEGGGLGLQYEGFKSPTSKLGFIISADFNSTGCEEQSIDLNYNGSNTKTDVNYYSSMNKITGGGILAPLQGSLVSPYLSMQGGVMWYRTKLVIEDPDDPSACDPLETKNVKTSVTPVVNLESGVKVQLKRKTKKPLFLQAGVGYNIGTRASYIKLGDGPNDETTLPYTSKFRMGDGSVHQHSIGTMYRTRTSQLVYSVGINFYFDCRGSGTAVNKNIFLQ
jgi:hypothetical protein